MPADGNLESGRMEKVASTRGAVGGEGGAHVDVRAYGRGLILARLAIILARFS
jgi:hypothetical protein